MLVPLDLPPGVYRNGTAFQSQGRYYDADLWRWFGDSMRPIGGWRVKSDPIVSGKARAMIAWVDNTPQSWTAIGTHSGLYSMSRSGATSNITPYASTASLTDPFTTTNGSEVVTVADTAHGRATGDWVVFSGANAVGGITLDGAYEMTVTGDDAYTVVHSEPATSAANGGGSVTAGYRITAGREDATIGGGYGRGLYGVGLYGTPRTDPDSVDPPSIWSLDTWGENLIACFEGVIYEWAPDPDVVAAAIPGAPAARSILVTDKRFLMALGTNDDPREVLWSDAEDNTNWTPSSTSLAGSVRLQTGGDLKCGRRVRGGVLLWTDIDVHFGEYVGLPDVHRFTKIGADCGTISPGSPIVADTKTFWMGLNGFWVHDGYVSPLASEVSEYVFGDINRDQVDKVAGVHISQWGEVWWCYPSGGSVENDRYVSFNYREGHWNIGSLARLSGIDRGVLPYPLMAGPDGTIYEHEVAQNRDGRQPYALAGPVEIGDGSRTMEIEAIIPDEQSLGDVSVSFEVGDWPMDETSVIGPFTASAKTDCRFSARRVAPRFTAGADQDFRVGLMRFEGKPGSPR